MRPNKFFKKKVYFISSLCILLTIIIIRQTGFLQRFELLAYDFLIKSSSEESVTVEDKIVIVGITEADIQNIKSYPFSDSVFASVLKEISAQKPRVIGFDVIRDQPVPPGYEEIASSFQTIPNIIGVKKITGTPIKAPQELEKLGQVGDGTGVIDVDGVVRRGYLYPVYPDSENPRSFPLEIAFRYLSLQNIKFNVIEPTKNNPLKIGKVSIPPLKGNEIYRNDRGYQILISWWIKRNFKQVSITDVLNHKIPDDLFTDRIVLIGAYSPSLKDSYFTPYSQGDNPQKMYGVEIQANIISQLLSAGLNHKYFLKIPSTFTDYLWLAIWIFLATISLWLIKEKYSFNPLTFVFTLVGSVIILVVFLINSSYFLLLNQFWLSFVPPLIGIILVKFIGTIYIYIVRIFEEQERYVNTLKKEVQEKTQELEKAQQQIMAQERLVYLGRLTAGLNHEIKNLFSLIARNSEFSISLVEDLESFCDDLQSSTNNSNPRTQDIISETLEDIKLNEQKIKDLSIRGNNLRDKFLPIEIFNSNEKLAFQQVELVSLLREAYRLIAYEKRLEELEALKPTLEEDYDESLLEIQAVPTELMMVFIYLIDNAWDAIQEKQRKTYTAVDVKEYNPKITIAARNKPGGLVEIIIQDNGIGISEEISLEIFKPFVTNKPSGKGTGLGLAIAHDIIVGRYQGSMEFQSILTETGETETKFIINIPLSQSKNQQGDLLAD